jgi:hypothetical protein
MSEEQNVVNPDAKSPEERRESTPLWVKLAGGVAILVIVVFVVLHLTGNGMVGH